MIYKTILTSKGTTTIPIEVRKQLGVRPGMYVSFTKNKMGEYVLSRSQTIDEIRSMNSLALRQANTATKQYKSGMGYESFVAQKFGNE